MTGASIKFSELKKGEYPGIAVEVGDESLDKLVKQFPAVIVDCWAPWCGPCRAMTPTIDELATAMKGKVVFAKLNTDDSQNTAMALQIMAIPTLLFYKDGKLVERSTGLQNKKGLEALIKKTFG
jgi:thioredoxin 1